MKKLDIQEAVRTHNAVFVSSIRTYGNLGPFRPLDRADFKGIRLFDMLLRPHQVVCGSTVKAGDPEGTLYGNWGVIVGSGDIQQAFPYDAASYVLDGQAISPYGWRNEGVDITTQLDRAINYRSGHNEVDIALGERSIAGLFFGSHTTGADGVDMPSSNVLEMIEPLHMPLYRLRNGMFYSMDQVGHVSRQPVAPIEIIGHGIDVPPEQADYMKFELSKRLLLPPRNAISAGWLAGKAQLDTPHPAFHQEMKSILKHDDSSHRYFGSMAVFAAEHTPLQEEAVFDGAAYTAFVDRIQAGGMLRASQEDIDHYLFSGDVPPYLGKI